MDNSDLLAYLKSKLPFVEKEYTYSYGLKLTFRTSSWLDGNNILCILLLFSNFIIRDRFKTTSML